MRHQIHNDEVTDNSSNEIQLECKTNNTATKQAPKKSVDKLESFDDNTLNMDIMSPLLCADGQTPSQMKLHPFKMHQASIDQMHI